MALVLGTMLGRYQIRELIGSGGQGEVYRAWDTALNRDVAVKVLPSSNNPELKQRFQREALALATLSHPHICQIFDVGSQDGIDFLVMEYLQGETLAQRLERGALPLEEALRYAVEISDALDHAHRKGFTHRDIKSNNLMLTKAGSKVLDFGLAKLRSLGATPTSQTNLPTGTLTGDGRILGTLQYMAPEQLEGKEADARTDIFAFGAVVYEMVTGRKAFEGSSQASLIVAIMSADPPSMLSLQQMTPPGLDHVVKTCLAKKPDDRWQTATDLTRELKWITEARSQVVVPAPPVSQDVPVAPQKDPLSSARLAWSVAAVLLVAVLALGALAYFQRGSEGARTMRFFVSPPDGWSLAQVGTVLAGSAAPLAVSPDGHRIAFVARSADGRSLLWVRSVDTLTAQPLVGTEGASSPFWSPDSRSLGFFAGGKLKKVEVSGGPLITLCDASDNRGGTWNRDGVIVFTPTFGSALQKISASGGVPTAATTLGQGEIGHLRPFFLPDGRHFLYRVITGSAVYLGSLDSAERKLLLKTIDSQNFLYTQGHLVFLRETTLMAQPFDVRRLELGGEAFPIAEQIQTQAAVPYGVFSASDNGVLAYQKGAAAAASRLVWFDRTGKELGALGDPAAYLDVELSPDDKRVAVSISDQGKGTRDIWLYDVARGLKTRFTFDPASVFSPIWSPDASRIVFGSSRKGHPDLYQKASSGAGTEEVLLEDNLSKTPMTWSPDGRFILYNVTNAPQTGFDLWVLPLAEERKPFPFLKTLFQDLQGRFSPDGRWVAYVSNESGKSEVYVQPFPGPGGKWQVSTGGGLYPRWRGDGSEIFYLAVDNRLMVAPVSGRGSSFEVGGVKPLSETRIPPGQTYQYDVSADGQRFLIVTAPEQGASPPITVVVNWTAELKKK